MGGGWGLKWLKACRQRARHHQHQPQEDARVQVQDRVITPAHIFCAAITRQPITAPVLSNRQSEARCQLYPPTSNNQ